MFNQLIQSDMAAVQFILSVIMAIFSGIGLLILLCIGWRVWQAAWQNPAEVIKSE